MIILLMELPSDNIVWLQHIGISWEILVKLLDSICDVKYYYNKMADLCSGQLVKWFICFL